MKVARRRPQLWLRLYLAGQTPRSVIALAAVRKMCAERLPKRCRLDVIDVLAQPDLAHEDQIIAVPTLVRRLPAPMRRVVGDLTRKDDVLRALELDEPEGTTE